MALQRHHEDISAIRAALDLLALPSRRRYMRERPLPGNIVLLLRIVVDDPNTVDSSATRAQASPKRLRQAAEFYIEQVMLAPHSDSYRVLGGRRNATAAELRQNLAYLCKWLHSDVCQNTMQSVFLLRVTQAWNDLKTPERRSAYDAKLDARLLEPNGSRRKRDQRTSPERRKGRGLLPIVDTCGGRKRRSPDERGAINFWRELADFVFGPRLRR